MFVNNYGLATDIDYSLLPLLFCCLVGETRTLRLMILTEDFYQPPEACELMAHVNSLGIYGWGPSIYLPEWPTFPPIDFQSRFLLDSTTTNELVQPKGILKKSAIQSDKSSNIDEYIPFAAAVPSPSRSGMLCDTFCSGVVLYFLFLMQSLASFRAQEKHIFFANGDNAFFSKFESPSPCQYGLFCGACLKLIETSRAACKYDFVWRKSRMVHFGTCEQSTLNRSLRNRYTFWYMLLYIASMNYKVDRMSWEANEML